METLGRHVIAELDGCDPHLLSDVAAVRRLLLSAARKAGARALADEMFDFQNGGVSGFVLLAESHISIHTWPEHRYAAVDIYTCGRHTMPDAACACLAEWLGATGVRTTSLNRGIPTPLGGHDHYLSPPRRELGFSTLAKLSNSA